MSSSTETSESRLNALECHFIWHLQSSKFKLTCLRDALEDMSNVEGNFWLGQIYNLLGFIQYQLGASEDALNLFNQAAEIFKRQKNADEGPWLMVTFGNLAWLHHNLGEDERSDDYLSKVDDLMRKYPAPPGLERHPEVYAEKAWTLMKFDKKKKRKAKELFQRAIPMQPDTVEWQSSYAILSAEVLIKRLSYSHPKNVLGPEVFERLSSAKERDPGNLYVAALYLEACAANGEQIKEEARVLAEKVLERPMNSSCGFVPLLRLYRNYISKDETIEIAKEALRRHPNSRYTKKCAAICHMRKILNPGRECNPDDHMINRGIRLWEEMIAYSNDSTLKQHITLTNLYSKVDTEKAEQIYREQMLREDLDQAEKQMLYSCYAKHLYFIRNESHESTVYHMRAAEIQVESKYRKSSIKELRKTLEKNRHPELIGEINNLLNNLENLPEAQNQ